MNARARAPGKAEAMARAAHATHVEPLSGDPYVYHLERVAALVESDDEKATAWLHDIIEDTPTTAADLRAAGIAEAIITAVELLTRTGSEPYAAYIGRIKASGNALALAVKRADLKDHLRPKPVPLPDRMLRKYEPALTELS